uniref:Uncharacterized protein n=1 Tax=Kalanchoe fedtschenkoi TaxID=63787 RepID=A0A7N0UMT7_KALFE
MDKSAWLKADQTDQKPSPVLQPNHQDDIDEEDDSVKQLGDCSALYLSLQVCPQGLSSGDKSQLESMSNKGASSESMQPKENEQEREMRISSCTWSMDATSSEGPLPL